MTNQPRQKYTLGPQWLINFGLSLALLILSAGCGTELLSEPDTSYLLDYDGVKMASFNIERFSDSRSDEEMDIIAEIVSRYDFIAIQETRERSVVKDLINVLYANHGLVYASVISEKRGLEYYVFVYKTDAVKANTDISGHIDTAAYSPPFIREPFYCEFATKKYTFYAVNFHIIYGDGDDDPKSEVVQLDDIYDSIEAIAGSGRQIAFFGDFNLSSHESEFDDLRGKGMEATIFGETTIADSDYDDIFINRRMRDNAYNYQSGIYRFDELLYDNNDAAAEQISDHRPVWALFK